VNAVIAWRAAGRYAHARVVLERVRARVPADGELALRVRLLDEKLAELTAALVLDGLGDGGRVTIDGVPAERLGGDIVVDVGVHELVVEEKECEPFRATVALLPTERQVVKVELACATRGGNLHITLVSGLRADVFVDGAPYAIPMRDLDVSIAPGPHHLVVRRMGVAIADETVEVAPAVTTTRKIAVPWRAQRFGLTLAAVGAGMASGADSAVGAGVAMGFIAGLGPRSAAYLWIEVGKAANDAEGMGTDTYLGLALIYRFLGPVWTRRSGRALYTLDVDPFSMHMMASGRGSTLDGDNVTLFYFGIGAITFTAEIPWAHLEATLWPAGLSTYSNEITGGDHDGYCAGVTLGVGWSVLGL
jgi:hypothetical protein